MEKIINGKELNKEFIKSITKRVTQLFEDARLFSEQANAEEIVEKIDDKKFIKKEDKEEYNILMTLLAYLEYEKEPAENTYEFKGLEYTEGIDTKKTTIYVSKENALKISKLANDYESKLARSNNPEDHKMSIKFPVELLLLKYKGTNMPGLDYEAPEPKTADQTDVEYEEGLETYYNGHGIDKTDNETIDFREPYPHEKINYRENPPTMSNVVQGGYYSSTVEELSAAALGTEHGDPGLDPGEEEPIVGTDRGLGRRIGDGLLNIKNIFKSDSLLKNVTKGLIICGLGYTAISCLIASPGVTLMLAGGAALVGGTAKLVFPKIKKAYKAIKKKISEWLFGPRLTDEPNGGEGGEGGTDGHGQDPEPTPEPTMTAQQILDGIAEIYSEINLLNDEVRTLDAEIAALADNDPQKAAKQAQRTEKMNLIRTKKIEITSMLHQHDLDASQPDVAQSRGGRGAR